MKIRNLISGLLLASMPAVAMADLTPAQEKAQLNIYTYLHKAKMEPKVDDSDNSVNFYKDGTLYWITFKNESPILYTFHRKGFKVGMEDNNYKKKPAVIAANRVNLRHPAVKAVVDDKRVSFEIQVYASRPEDLTSVLNSYLAAFENVDADFKKEYKAAELAERQTMDRLEAEARKNLPPSELRDMIVGVSFRLLDEFGNEKSTYDQPLRSFNAQFVQMRLEFAPWNKKAEEFDLQIKVTRPDGRPIYVPGEKYSAEAKILLEKSKKTQTFEVDQFGTNEKGFWKAGEYKLEVFEGGDAIFTTSFNIL